MTIKKEFVCVCVSDEEFVDLGEERCKVRVVRDKKWKNKRSV